MPDDHAGAPGSHGGDEITLLDPQELAAILRNKLALDIIIHLSRRDFYPRELAALLGKSEAQVSKVLRKLEQLGIVESRWVTIKGKNVKVYHLKYREVGISFTPTGLVVRLGHTVVPVRRSLPLAPPEKPRPIGRDDLLLRLDESADKDLVVVVGPPGTGKTHLVAYWAGRVRDRPVVYLRMAESYTIVEVSRSIGSYLNYLGYDVDVNTFNALEERDRLVEILSSHRILLVVDDLHKVRDPEVSRLVRYLAAMSYGPAYDYRVVLVTRSIDRRLARWKQRYTRIDVGPLSPQAFATLASRASGTVEFTVEDAIILSQKVPLLPIIAINLGKVAARIGKGPAMARVTDMYYRGMLRDVVESESAYTVIRLMSFLVAPAPREVVCRALPFLDSCMEDLRELESNGIVETDGDRVKLHDFYLKVRDTIPPDEARLLQSTLGLSLVSSEDDLDKIQGLLLLSESCSIRDLARVVEERLALGSQWPFSNLTMYARALSRALTCSPPPRARKIIEAEKAIMEIGFSDSASVARILWDTAEYYRLRVEPGKLRNTLVVRLYSLAAIYFKQAGMLREAEKAINMAYREAARYEEVEKQALTTLLNNMISLLVALGKFEDALKVAEELVNMDIDDIEDYLFALSMKADLLRILGRLDEAEQELVELWSAISRLPNFENKPLTFNVAWSLAYLYAEKGDFEKALYYARLNHERASKLATALPFLREWADLYAADVAVIRALQGDIEEARRLFPRGKCKGRETRGLWVHRCFLYQYIVEGEREDLPPARIDMLRLVKKYGDRAGS